MQVKAKLNYLRIAPRKLRLLADLIRSKKIEEAQAILNFTVKKGSDPILKLLASALANAKNNFQLDPSNLYISKITVDEGPKYKRWMPRARGNAAEIQKKTSHITLVLDELKPGKKVKKEKKEPVSEKKESVKMPRASFESQKPKIASGINKIFRRKSI